MTKRRTRRAAITLLVVAAAATAALALNPGHAGATATTQPLPESSPTATRVCGPAAVSNVEFVTSAGRFQSLHGHVRPGDHVTAFFSVQPGCQVSIRLSSYYEALPRWGDLNTESYLYQNAVKLMGPGSNLQLGPIGIPNCNFQVDLRVEYRDEITRLSSDNGGSTDCANPQVSAQCVAVAGNPVLQVSLANPGPGGVAVTVRRSSSPSFSDTVQLAPGSSAVRTYGFGTVLSDSVLFSDNQEPPLHDTVPVSWCGAPVVTGTYACQSGQGVATFTATNSAPLGSPPETVTIEESSVPVLSLTVPAADTVSGTTTYAPNAPPTFTATSAGGYHATFGALALPGCTSPSNQGPPPSYASGSGSPDVDAGGTTNTYGGSTVIVPPPSIPPVSIGIPTTTTSLPPPVSLGASTHRNATSAGPPGSAGTAPLSDKGPILTFTGATLRTLLSWLIILSVMAAVILLISAVARKADPAIPVP